jgi:site-specific DNA recombinase
MSRTRCLRSCTAPLAESFLREVTAQPRRRERYRGVIAWGEFEKTYSLGTKVRVRRAADDADRVRVEVPELRIVDDDLWFAVQARFTRREGGAKHRGRLPRHLLSGIGRCAECGGPIIVMRSDASWGYAYLR